MFNPIKNREASKGDIMKIAISSTGKTIDSDVDPRFGRCKYFLIAEIKNKEITKTDSFENPATEKTGGAGIFAAKAVAEKDVGAVITGNIGPRAQEVLKQFNVKIYEGEGTAKDALQKFIENKLKKID